MLLELALHVVPREVVHRAGLSTALSVSENFDAHWKNLIVMISHR